MTIYLGILILIGYLGTILSIGPNKGSATKRLQALSAILVAIILILVLSFRSSSVGVDVDRYLYYWSLADSRNLFEITRFEPAFILLTIISRSLVDSPQFFLTLVAILSLAPISYAIRKGSARPLWSWGIYICLGFYAFTFSGLRQAIAYGLTTLAIHSIREKKLILFLSLVALASSFHASALVFLPAYWVYKLRINRFSIAAYILIVSFIFVFREPIFRWITERFYSSYEVSASSSYAWLLLSGAIVFLSWTQLYHTHRGLANSQQKEDIAGLLKLATMGVTLMLFASVGNNVMRMADYYYVAIIFALPAVLDIVPKRYRPLIKMYTIIGLVAVYIMQMMQSPYGIVPYALYKG